MDLAPLLSLDDVERAAREVLPAMARDYYASGAWDESTLAENRAAYARRRLLPRVLVDVARRSTATRVLGHELSFPVLAAPTAFHCMAHPEGERATARAVTAAGSVMVLSTLSTQPVEQVVAAATGPVWFQLYAYRDRGATRDLVARAEAAGCRALVLTVDAPVLGRRERDVRNRFALPAGMHVANLRGGPQHEVPAAEHESGLAQYFARLVDPALSWDDLAWLRGLTRLPLLVKGVLRPDDARRAAAHGAAAVVVSNHGGRQLDGAVAAVDALPAVAGALAGSGCEVLVDGGVRRGTDVLRALALGARAVLVGRPLLWGLAVGGEAGVAHVLRLLREEVDHAMALCGCRSVAEVTPDLLAPTVA